MDKFGKVMESVRADLENYSAWVSNVPSFGYNFAFNYNKLKYFKNQESIEAIYRNGHFGFSLS